MRQKPSHSGLRHGLFSGCPLPHPKVSIDHGDRESPLTWEPVIIKVAQSSNALAEMCIVGVVTTKHQLLLQGSLENRMEETGKRKHKENQQQQNKNNQMLKCIRWLPTGKNLGKGPGTQSILLKYIKSLSVVQPRWLQRDL